MSKLISWGEFPLPLIQVSPPDIRATDAILQEAYELGIFSNSGVLNRRASYLMAQHLNQNLYGYLCSNNTMGLVSCFLSIGVRDKYVIVSNFTFAATVHAIILAGGIPFLCDVNESSLEMTKETIFKVVNENRQNIAAVCPTRIFGSANDFSDLVEFCNDLELPVLVDAAGAYPGQPNSWKFNQTAKYEVFSLHATKVFGIGEGGLVVGAFNDIEEVRNRSNFGLSGNPQDGFTDGINAKADEFTAARAIARFPTFGADILSRAAFAKEYDSFFKTLSSVSVLPFNERGTYSLFPVRFNSEQQLLDFQEATEHIILTRRYYFPSLSEGYRGTARIKLSSNLSVSNTAAQTTLCLPVYSSYSSEVVPRLLDLFSKIIGEK